MQWQYSLYNYHKLALIVSILVFILLSPPIFKFFQRNTSSMFFVALIIALIVWSFTFIILHILTYKYNSIAAVDETY